MKFKSLRFVVLVIILLGLGIAITFVLSVYTPSFFLPPTTYLTNYTVTTPLPPQIKHVIIIAEENEPYNAIVNCSCAPYQNKLIQNFSLAKGYFSPEHPSLPNYVDLTAGSDLGETFDCTPPTSCSVNATNITDLLKKDGLTWKEYAESMPAPCYLQNYEEYTTKHNPFVYYSDITGNSTYCDQNVVPMNLTTGTGLVNDLNSKNLPNYSFVTPNLCDDGHDSCSPLNNKISQIDAWLQKLVPEIIHSAEYNSTALFIVYDEGSYSTAMSHVACILVSPFSKKDYSSPYFFTHFSLLATVEQIFGMGSLGRNDTQAIPMNDMFS